MEYRTDNLILRPVTEEDLAEVARTWPSGHHPLSDEEARAEITRMQQTHSRNTAGRLHHLCLAVFDKNDPRTIRGWVGLDGRRNPSEPEIFVLLQDKDLRGKGNGTQCMKLLFRIAAEEYALSVVHGGCHKENTASARAMEKAGMILCGHAEDGGLRYMYKKS